MITLLPYSGNGNYINVVIETPKGSRNKYTYDPEADLFKVSKTLPAGSSFSFDFGFIPGTMAEDGDPLDVVVMTENAGYPGCYEECRVIGVVEATVKKGLGKKIRNDRILSVFQGSRDYSNIKTYKDLDQTFLNDLCHFFEYYSMMRGKTFKVTTISEPQRAHELIKISIREDK